MVSSICKFGITYILPNNSWILRCFCSVKLVVYAVHAQCMQCHASMAIRRLGSLAIIPGARWCVVCVSFDVSGCTLSPLPPGGAGKTGRLSGRSPCVTTHSLLRLPAKHRPARKFSARETHGKRTERVFGVCSPQHVLDRSCLSVCFARLSERVRRYPMQDLVEARRRASKAFHASSGVGI